MGLAGFLNHWWNAPFLVMLSLVAVYFVMQVVGLAGHGSEADADGDADVDADADADADVDADADADADVDGDADGDADADGHGGAGAPTGHAAGAHLADHVSVLGFFGIGRVPLMVAVSTLFLFAGLTGVILNGFVFSHAQGE